MALATFAGGCFWCTEAVFQRLNGVTTVTSGYAGSPPAESLQIEFDPGIISYETLLEVFFATHDPASLDRQGADVGSQYRSAVFYHDDTQRTTAEIAKAAVPGAITEIVPLKNFTPAESYHQNYYNQNQAAPYCQLVISPKLKKLFHRFPRLIVP